jgi:hypothetical protein
VADEPVFDLEAVDFMKALVYRGPFDVNVEDVPDASVQDPTDAVIRVSHELPPAEAASGYEHFDKRKDGWTTVVLHPGADPMPDTCVWLARVGERSGA